MPESIQIWQVVLFFISAAAVLDVSWRTLVHPRSHGFTRTFAWLAIAALVALNLPVWFRKPLSWYQVLSWLLLIGSIYWVVAGLRQLRVAGQPDAARADDPALIGLEKTTQLATSGVYRYVRHPMYASLLFLAWGAFFKMPSLVGAGLALLASLCLWLTAQREERENIAFFGEPSREYMQQTKMFVPYIL